MKKNIFLILLSFYSVTFFSQIKEFDSIYHKINNVSVFTKKEFNEVTVFNQKLWEFGKLKRNYLPYEYDSIYQKALSWAELNKNIQNVLTAKKNMMYYYYRKGDFERFLKIGIELSNDKNLQQTKEIVPVLKFLISYYRETEQFTEYLELFPKLRKFVKKYKIDLFRLEEGWENSELGIIYYRLKDFKKSRYYFKKSSLGFEKEKKYFSQASAMNNIGLSYLQENKLDSANFYFKKALKLIDKKVKDRKSYITDFIAVIKANKATILEKQKQYNKALPYYLDELQKNKTEGLDYSTVRSAYLKIARVYFLKKEPVKALIYLDSTKLILDKRPNKYIEERYLDLKAKSLLYSGKLEQANKYFKKLNKYRDSISKNRLEQKTLVATIKY